MRILISGADGQVGSSLIKHLENSSSFIFLSLNKNQLDITDFVSVKIIVTEFKPDIIINAAAYTAVDKAEAEADTAYRINAEGAKNLAQAAKLVGAAIFHISTDYVFDGTLSKPYTESEQTNPLSIYGNSKLKGEQLVMHANPKHIILRTSWIFGEYGNNFVKTMIRLGKERSQINVVYDQLGGPTYAGDIAKTLIKIALIYEKNRQISWGIYHFSGMPHTNWFEFATSIFDELSTQKVNSYNVPIVNPITTLNYPLPARRPANSRLDCNKIYSSFGIEASDWRKALKNITAYL